jgi:hypothetical protein
MFLRENAGEAAGILPINTAQLEFSVLANERPPFGYFRSLMIYCMVIPVAQLNRTTTETLR